MVGDLVLKVGRDMFSQYVVVGMRLGADWERMGICFVDGEEGVGLFL